MENLLDEIKNKLKEKGYKFTPQREKILNIIIKNQTKHLTSDEIYMNLKNDYPNLGLATVYRTLQLLEQNNIVYKFDSNEDGVRYELIEPNDKYPHPHFICKNCGKIYAVKDLILDSLKNQLNKKYAFKILNCEVKFYGICENCVDLQN